MADRAIDEGALETAVRLLEQAKARVASLSTAVEDAEADIARKRAEFASVFARSGDAHALALDFALAAADYEQAYRQVERWDDRLAWTYRHRQTEALERQGTLGGDTAALLAAIDTANDALRLAAALDDERSEMSTRNVLGNALFTLGDRDSEPTRLSEAVAAFRSVLDEQADMDSGMLAKVRNNLANALTVLGTRTGDDAMLSEAVDLYEVAIDRFEEEENPILWASAMTNFGKTMIALGELRNSVEILETAEEAFQAALGMTPRDQQPAIWGVVQNNLGNAHQAIGLRTENPLVAAGRHLQALIAYRNALGELARERVPVQWASVQQNMGNTLQSLAYRAPNADQARDYLQQALEAQDAALGVMTRETAPGMWTTVKLSMGYTNQLRANVAATPAEASDALEAAAAAQREALEVLAPETAGDKWYLAQIAYAETLQRLSMFATDAAGKRTHLLAAEAAQRAALESLPGDRPSERAATQHALGLTLLEIGPLEGGTARYEQAEKLFREEQALLSRDHEAPRWAAAQAGLGNALRALGIARADRPTLEEARRRTQEAWDVIRPFDARYDGILSARIAEIDAALAGLN
jgi:tetratricopeptide (TPR) repeat protein